MKLLTLLLVGAAASFNAYANSYPAPLGMNWGDDKGKIESEYQGKKIGTSDGFDIYKVDKPPVILPGFDTVIDIVSPAHGLVKVVLMKEISNDAFGDDGLDDYKKYKALLQKKYGKPESYEYIGKKMYNESDEFYQCLKYQGCGSYSSYFKPKQGGSVSIDLQGKSRGVGTLRLFYESDLFGKAKSEKEAEKEKVTESAL